jgi:hypothetical protein
MNIKTVECAADGAGIVGDTLCGVERGAAILDAEAAACVEEADVEAVGA